MAERITRKNLDRAVSRLNKMTKSPETAWTRTASGELVGNIGHYYIDGNIGGVALEQVTGKGGSVRQVLERGTARSLYERIHAYMSGLDQCPSTNYRDNPRTKKKTAKRKSRAKYKHEDIRPASSMAKGSIRTVKRGKKRVRIGCPKGPGHYNKKTGRCRVGTRAVSILVPNPKEKTFRIFTIEKRRVAGKLKPVYLYWDGFAFTRRYQDAEKFYREVAIAKVRATHKKHPHIVLGVSDGKA